MTAIKNLLNVCAALTVIVSLAQLFPGKIHLFQLLEAFQLQTLIGAMLLLVISAWFKRLIPAVVFIVASISVGIDTWPYVFNTEEGVSTESGLSLVHANVWHHNEEYDELIPQLLAPEPDVILIQELSDEWAESMSATFSEFPYRVLIPHPECCYGIGLFSKLPIQRSDTVDVSDTPALRVTIESKNGPIDIFYLHTRPPAFPDETEERNQQLRQVEEWTHWSVSPWILVGDLNVVPWSEPFKMFLESSGGVDARKGAFPTFPSSPFPLIPIDHLVHSDRLVSNHFETIDLAGSDHRGIVVRFD